jgi:hypothetical protein
VLSRRTVAYLLLVAVVAALWAAVPCRAEPTLITRWPALGQPCLVYVAPGAQGVTFRARLVGRTEGITLSAAQAELNGHLFLQRLADTRQYQQDSHIQGLERMADLPPDLQGQLVHLSVQKIEYDRQTWGERIPNVGSYDREYWVTLEAGGPELASLEVPQLLNLVQDFADDSTPYRVSFHSVYLHRKTWSDFGFIHATDTHVAYRNDLYYPFFATADPGCYFSFVFSGYQTPETPEQKQERLADLKRRLVNPNQNFRNLITYANDLHRRGQLDFLLVTGDLADFVMAGGIPKYVRTGPGRMVSFSPRGSEGFQTFRDLVIGLNYFTSVVGEELEVPIFTVPGNHDYRLAPYPLVSHKNTPYLIFFGYPEVEVTSEYGSFGLSRVEGMAWEGGFSAEYSSDALAAAAYWGEGNYKPGMDRYQSIVNPDLDYMIPLGKHKIICLDSGHDEEVIKGADDMADQWLGFGSESENDFVAGHPDTSGFTDDQLEFLVQEVADANGLIIAAFHAPAVNMRDANDTPWWMLRESERWRLKDEAWQQALAGHLLAAYLWDHLSSVTNTPYFKTGGRDPDLSRGVVDFGFWDYPKLLSQAAEANKTGVLVLTGHTHRNVEYIVRWTGGTYRYYHDSYIDNTLHGKRATEWWSDYLSQQGSPVPPDMRDYPDPLNASKDPERWWAEHSPLYVQTIGLGPKPPNEDEVGCLLVTVQSDTISRMDRVNLSDIRAGLTTRHIHLKGEAYDGHGGPLRASAQKPYFIAGDVTVPAGKRLTIEGGVTVQFNTGARIIADGTLAVSGAGAVTLLSKDGGIAATIMPEKLVAKDGGTIAVP